MDWSCLTSILYKLFLFKDTLRDAFQYAVNCTSCDQIVWSMVSTLSDAYQVLHLLVAKIANSPCKLGTLLEDDQLIIASSIYYLLPLFLASYMVSLYTCHMISFLL